MTNYKCNNCGGKFEGEDFILECLSCGSNDITEASASGDNKFIEVIKNNKRFAIIIGIILSVIVLFSTKNCGGKEIVVPTELSIKTNNKDNYIEILLIDVKKKEKFLFDKNPKTFVEAGFKAFQNGEQITVIEGKIYPCTSDFVKLTWNKGFGEISSPSKMISSFKIKTEVNKRATCIEKLTLRVKPSECDCELEVFSNYDEIDPSKTIMISINGRNGVYRDQKEWKLNKNKNNYDVWGYLKGRDTVQAIPGSGRIKGCVKFDASGYVGIAKKYAENPGNLKALSRFKLVTSSSFIIMYKNEKMNLNDLSNKLRTEWKNNGTIFKVNIKWKATGGCGDSNKTVSSINFY
jgi:hypothetical protein